MTKLLLNEKLNDKNRKLKKNVFLEIITFFKKVVKKNKLEFFISSLLASVSALVNFIIYSLYSNLFAGKNNQNGQQDNTKSWKNLEILTDGSPQLKLIFDFFKLKKNLSLRMYVVLILVLNVLKFIISTLHWYTITHFTNKTEKNLKTELFEILTNSNYEKSSELANKMIIQFSSDIYDISYNIWSIPNRIIYSITSVLLIIISLILEKSTNKDKSFQTNYLLIAIIFSLIVSVSIIISLLLRKSTKLAKEAKIRSDEDSRFIFERISNLEYIKSVSSEKIENNKMENRLNNTFQKNQISEIWTVLFRSIPDYLLIPSIPYIFILILTSNFFFGNKLIVNSAEAFVFYFFSVRSINSDISKIFDSITLIDELSNNLSLVTDNINFLTKGSKIFDHQKLVGFSEGNIIFDKVSFAYPLREQIKVIDNFSFVFEKGKKYGIAGKNGIGKSTITRILLKLYKISSGNVLIGQNDLSLINTTELQQNICRLNNRPSFFKMSIAENVFYPFTYNEKQDLKKLTYAAKQTRIFSFIKSLSNSFNTVLREGGVDLSEGQKQQIEAMKIFIRDYKIYIFDEILSNVHPSTKKVILRNIFTNVKNRLVIAIDHHYDIFSHMDYVYKFSSKKLTRIKQYKKLLEN